MSTDTPGDGTRRMDGPTPSVAPRAARERAAVQPEPAGSGQVWHDARLLRWLLRFPLQSAPDLAAMSGLSVPQTYACLKRHELGGMVRGVRVPALGPQRLSGRLYHLTHAGLRALTSAFGSRVWSLAHAWGADEAGLLRALPRISALVTTQRLVLALLMHATRAFGTHDHPVRVEWVWERDHREAYRRGTRTRPRICHFDAYLLMTVIPAEGGPARSYPFFVVHDTGFGDVRLIRWRLRELLRCRDAFEEHRLSGSFPPLLLVVPSVHRARLWQAYALRLASEEWLIHPLRGGLIVEADMHQRAGQRRRDDEGTRHTCHIAEPCNPWHLSWYALDRSSTCSLGDLLRSTPSDCVPRLPADADDTAPEPGHGDAGDGGGCGEHPNMGSRARDAHVWGDLAGGLTTPAAHAAAAHRKYPSGTTNWEGWDTWSSSKVRSWAAWASLQVERRHARVLDLLAAHPLLSPANLAAVLDLEMGTIARYRAHLEYLGLVSPDARCEDGTRDPVTSAPSRWHHQPQESRAYALTQLGVYLLAAGAGLWVRRHATLRVAANSSGAIKDPPRRAPHDPGAIYARDIQACERIAEHTRGVYSFFALLHTALRATQPGRTEDMADQVVWWETGRACMRHYRTQQGWGAIRPDGAAEVVVHGRRVSLWLEWDRSTMGLRDLRAKFTAYAEYVRSREWRTDGNSPLPLLLIVTADTDGETRMVQALDDALPLHSPLAVRITSASVLYEHGPLGSIWRTWIPGTPSGRVALGASRGLADGS